MKIAFPIGKTNFNWCQTEKTQNSCQTQKVSENFEIKVSPQKFFPSEIPPQDAENKHITAGETCWMES